MLDFDPASVDVPSGHFIHGKVVAGGKDIIDVSRPSDGQNYAGVPLGSADDVDRAVSDSHKAFQTSSWSTMPPGIAQKSSAGGQI